jgi:hypothetical protein
MIRAINVWLENLHLLNLAVDGRKILKWIFGNKACFGGHLNETLDSIKANNSTMVQNFKVHLAPFEMCALRSCTAINAASLGAIAFVHRNSKQLQGHTGELPPIVRLSWYSGPYGVHYVSVYSTYRHLAGLMFLPRSSRVTWNHLSSYTNHLHASREITRWESLGLLVRNFLCPSTSHKAKAKHTSIPKNRKCAVTCLNRPTNDKKF